MKFYKVHGQVIIVDKDLPVGEELHPNTTDAAGEKHVPVISFPSDNEVKVEIGSVEHPTLEAHYIEWICLVTDKGMQIKWLKPGMKPEAFFMINKEDTPLTAYEYCNLHGLWKAKV